MTSGGFPGCVRGHRTRGVPGRNLDHQLLQRLVSGGRAQIDPGLAPRSTPTKDVDLLDLPVYLSPQSPQQLTPVSAAKDSPPRTREGQPAADLYRPKAWVCGLKTTVFVKLDSGLLRRTAAF